MAQDPFGNYVVQYVLELGHTEATESIMRQLCGHYPELAQQKFSSNVVEKCLKLGGQGLAEMRERVIRELLNSPLMPRLLQVTHRTSPRPPLPLHKSPTTETTEDQVEGHVAANKSITPVLKIGLLHHLWADNPMDAVKKQGMSSSSSAASKGRW